MYSLYAFRHDGGKNEHEVLEFKVITEKSGLVQNGDQVTIVLSINGEEKVTSLVFSINSVQKVTALVVSIKMVQKVTVLVFSCQQCTEISLQKCSMF